MSQYAAYKNFDLRRMLKQRKLRVSGNKAELVSRLDAYDVDHPFCFLKLPAEIRNEIYKYVARSDHTSVFRNPSHHIEAREVENHKFIQQPGLFRTCSQIHTESRLLFYRYHVFKLHVWQDDNRGFLQIVTAWIHNLLGKRTCLERVWRWLDAIGVEARKQIRTVEVDLHLDEPASAKIYIRFMDDLHARLSDEATVAYRSASQKRHFADLWELGKTFYDRDPSRLLRFEYPGWNLGPLVRRSLIVWTWTRAQVLNYPIRRRDARPSLIFRPGLGWFGGH